MKKHIPSFNEFVNEAWSSSYEPKPNVENEFTEELMKVWRQADEKGEIKWDMDELQEISDAVYWRELGNEVAKILNKDDFSKWDEKNLSFWVKKVSNYFKPKSLSVWIWDEFENNSWEIEQYKEEIKQAEADLKQLFSDQDLEAGEKGDDWSDEDANRYGEEMNDLEKKIDDLRKKIDWKTWKPKIEKATIQSSKRILKILSDL